jgi:hypothetical protein
MIAEMDTGKTPKTKNADGNLTKKEKEALELKERRCVLQTFFVTSSCLMCLFGDVFATSSSLLCLFCDFFRDCFVLFSGRKRRRKRNGRRKRRSGWRTPC